MTNTDASALLLPELVYADPKDLVIGENVRLDARLDKAFVASIRERGVLEPIVAYRDDTGALVVLRGKRRALAAVEAGRDAVPVAISTAPGDADRLVDQVVENEHRTGLAVAERVGAFEQLAALGLTAGQIAKRTGAKRTEVQAGLVVAESELARKATARWDFLTLDQAAAVAEFDDDTEAVKQLVQAAKQGGFDHVLQRARDDRVVAEAIAKATLELRAAGVAVVERYDVRSAAKVLTQLLPAGDGTDPITVEEHAACPGHAAFVEYDWVYPPGSDDDDEAQATLTTAAVYLCTDWKRHGHRWRYASPSTGSASAPADQEAAAEAARAQRRDVIDSNKAWRSAETVRRDWLRTFLSRKTAPKGAALFIAESLALCGYPLTEALGCGHDFYTGLLGLERPAGYGNHGATIVPLLAGVSASRGEMVALGLILAGHEAATSTELWRRPYPWAVRYLRYLEAQGYELSDVERRACGEQPASAEGGDAG